MNPKNKIKAQAPLTPCPPEEFAGRFNEKRKLLEILEEAKHQGQMVMVSGARGSGKSSFLEWAEYEIQNRVGGLESPAVKKAFMETPGMVFTTYKDLLTHLKGHQKFGWFKKTINNPAVKDSIGVTLGVLEKAALFTGPGKIVADAGIAVAKTLMPKEQFEYPQLLTSFLSVLRSLSDELTKNNRFLAILCDDVQWSFGPDYQLLKDLIRNLPAGIALIGAFRLEDKSMEKYVELRQELDRFGYSEIRLSGMKQEEIKDFAKLRYNLSIDDRTAEFLSMNIGDPFCLVGCFNLLQKRNIKADLANVEKILPEIVDPERCVYSELDQKWKEWVNILCILHSPLPLSLIACMLGKKEQKLASLQDELDRSVAFRRLEKESYDFAHPSLREYCREKLPDGLKIKLHSQAAECFESLRERLPDKWHVELSLAEHLFYGEKYEKALDLNLRLGDNLYDVFAFNLALELTERAKTCAEKTNNKRKLAHTLHQKGMILQSLYKFGVALDAYIGSLKISREIKNRAGEAKTLHQIGMVYELINRFKEALDYYNQSLEIEREIKDRAGEATTLHQIGVVYQLTNRFKEALDYYNQSLRIKREIGARALEATTLHQIGMVYEDTGRFDEALDFYNQSLKIEREIGNRAGEAQTLHQIGRVYEETNRFKEALDYYNQSLKIAKEIGNREGEAQTLHQIGMVYQKTNHFKEALDYYNQSLKLDRETGDRAGVARSLHQIGRVYQDTNRFDEALDYYNQSLEIKRDIKDRAGEAKTLHQIGIVYQLTNRFKEALDYYNHSLKINGEIGNRGGEAATLYHIGKVYMLTNRFEEALSYYNEGLKIDREVGNKEGEKISLEAIKELKEKMKKKK